MTGNDLPPYADALGIAVDHDEAGSPVLFFDYSERVAGRPGFLHGGAMSGLMEMACMAALRAEMERRGENMRLKPVNVQVEFMRGGTQQVTYALGNVTRAGRRVARGRDVTGPPGCGAPPPRGRGRRPRRPAAR